MLSECLNLKYHPNPEFWIKSMTLNSGGELSKPNRKKKTFICSQKTDKQQRASHTCLQGATLTSLLTHLDLIDRGSTLAAQAARSNAPSEASTVHGASITRSFIVDDTV